ncbi:MAG: hypothetical protein FWB84_08535 [Candidatus Bathyarchaeota archaeon]|nr:hypothetical protein [Candidatus Termiticorpusculum sp.]MCL2291457.1 hypothetical protein [Candidatus Termiticorpusculum sp.]
MVEGESKSKKIEGMSWEGLQKALKVALGAITLSDIAHWFKHNGYIVKL